MATVENLQKTLRLTYGLVPIVAGLDKFTYLLTDWSQYQNMGLIPIEATIFMKVVGIIEIIAGILVLARPLIGAPIVMAWLIAIALQLITMGHYLDIAVRDLVMSVGAFTLFQLTKITAKDTGK